MTDPVDTNEIWKPAVGFEELYEVSNLGRVRSFRKSAEGKLLRPGRCSNGYVSVSLCGRSVLVQYLVAEAFIGPRPTGALVLHFDGVRTNNALSNLRYGTSFDNRKDAERHGTAVIGSGYSSAKLNETTAKFARENKGVIPQSKLAKMLGVSPSAIQAVHDGRTWKHV